MVQEDDKPKKRDRKRKTPAPRPEAEQTPEPHPHLTPSEMDKIGKVADDALFLTREEQACVHLSMEESREKAAMRLGWSMKQVLDCLAQPHVKLYAIEYRETFMRSLAQNRVRSLGKVGVNRANLQSRLMELAMMDPRQTGGKIDGQVKACAELASILGLKDKNDPLRDKSDEELQEIVDRARGTEPKKPAVN